MNLESSPTNPSIKYRDTKRPDEEKFKSALHQAPWNTAFVFEENNNIVDSWEQIFISILDQYCPWREKRIKRANQSPWMTKPVLKQLQTRDHLLKVARRSDNNDDWKKYRTDRNEAVLFYGQLSVNSTQPL